MLEGEGAVGWVLQPQLSEGMYLPLGAVTPVMAGSQECIGLTVRNWARTLSAHLKDMV